MSVAAQLDAALKLAGLEISGVSLGVRADKSTWKVHPVEGAEFSAGDLDLIETTIAEFIPVSEPDTEQLSVAKLTDLLVSKGVLAKADVADAVAALSVDAIGKGI